MGEDFDITDLFDYLREGIPVGVKFNSISSYLIAKFPVKVLSHFWDNYFERINTVKEHYVDFMDDNMQSHLSTNYEGSGFEIILHFRTIEEVMEYMALAHLEFPKYTFKITYSASRLKGLVDPVPLSKS
jgi:hypothetical protein